MFKSILAQSTINLTDIDPFRLPGKDVPVQGIGGIINTVLTFVYPIGGVLLFFMIVWAGFDYFNSEGKPDKLGKAKSKITWAIVGYALLVLSFLLVKLIAFISGLDDQGL